MKYLPRQVYSIRYIVSTLVVEWIEIRKSDRRLKASGVSTLVVEWIEIIWFGDKSPAYSVSTLVVEWIEISINEFHLRPVQCLHPRGGVD